MASKQKKIKKTKKTDEENLIQCTACGKFKPKRDFFVSHKEMYAINGVIPYCKICLKNMCNNQYGEIDKDKFLQMLRTIDRPYIDNVWNKVIAKGGENIVGNYLKSINLVQYRDTTWEDSNFSILEKEKNQEEEKKEEAVETEPIAKKIKPIQTEREKMKKFSVTDEIIGLFGSGYTDEEYYHMWNKYKFLSANYTETTNMHTEALVTYIRYKVKEEIAIANNRPGDAKTWGDMAMRQAEKAKINPSQFSKADLQGGMNTIGEIAQAVEQNTNIIPILPQFKYRPNDAVDFCIWNYINYARDLEGKPLVEYKDVYKFYDKMKEDYINATGDPTGIFKDDPTEENRPKIEQFIQLPDEYYESEEDE